MHVQYKTGFVRVINNFLRECCAITSLNDYVLGSSTSSRNTIMLGVKNKEKLLHYQRKVWIFKIQLKFKKNKPWPKWFLSDPIALKWACRSGRHWYLIHWNARWPWARDLNPREHLHRLEFCKCDLRESLESLQCPAGFPRKACFKSMSRLFQGLDSHLMESFQRKPKNWAYTHRQSEIWHIYRQSTCNFQDCPTRLKWIVVFRDRDWDMHHAITRVRALPVKLASQNLELQSIRKSDFTVI